MLHPHEESADSREWPDAEADLPCPPPLESVVAAGYFGVQPDGSLRPSHDHIQALTAAHARELFWTVADIHYLNRCAKSHRNPDSGRHVTRPEARERLQAAIDADICLLRRKYEDGIAAYGDVFGDDAAEELDRFVNRFIRDDVPPEKPFHQRELF